MARPDPPGPPPRPSAEVAAADWLGPRLRPFGSAVAAVVPDGFPAYARLEHRADRIGDEPPEGTLPPAQLQALTAILGRHTATPGACWFCLWDGYGWLHGSPAVGLLVSRRGRSTRRGNAPPVPPVPPALPPEVLGGPRVRLPARDYLLFTGPLEAALALGWDGPGEWFLPQSPNLFWPEDHAWCVASEIDLPYTLVAGPAALVGALVADPRLGARPVGPGDPLAAA
jgi:hypothetical protein